MFKNPRVSLGSFSNLSETLGFLNILGTDCLKTQGFHSGSFSNLSETLVFLNILSTECLKTQGFHLVPFPTSLKPLGF